MKVFTPVKSFLKFSLWLLPFNLVCAGLIIIGVINQSDFIITLATILLLIIILIFSVGNRFMYRHNIMISKDSITFAKIDTQVNFLKVLLLQHDKFSINIEDIKKIHYIDTLNVIEIHSSSIDKIDVKGFRQKAINEMIKLVSERKHHG